MNRIIFILSAMVLTACVTTPQTYDFEKSRQYNLNFDSTWEGVISFFAENNISIQTLEKDSGIIVAENSHSKIKNINDYADCAVSINEHTIMTIKVNVFARQLSTDSTSLQVNTNFTANLRELMTGAPTSFLCTSKGLMESEILDAIEGRVVKIEP